MPVGKDRNQFNVTIDRETYEEFKKLCELTDRRPNTVAASILEREIPKYCERMKKEIELHKKK